VYSPHGSVCVKSQNGPSPVSPAARLEFYTVCAVGGKKDEVNAVSTTANTVFLRLDAKRDWSSSRRPANFFGPPDPDATMPTQPTCFERKDAGLFLLRSAPRTPRSA